MGNKTKHCKSTYSPSHKRYYENVRKKRTPKKVGLDIYTCPFCGMANTLTRLKSQQLYLKKIYIREGQNWFTPEEYSLKYGMPQLEGFVFDKWEEYMKDMCKKSLKFLKWAIEYKLVTKEEIILELNLKVIEKVYTIERVREVTPIPSINQARNFQWGKSRPVETLQSLGNLNSLENLKTIKPIRSI